jgi:hypothetical protein
MAEENETKIKFDEIDIKIIKSLGANQLTTTELAKRIFICNNDYELKQQDNFIRNRLKKLETSGFIGSKEKNNHSIYFNNDNCVVFNGAPKIIINKMVFKGQKGEYIFIIKNGSLSQILS